MNIPGCVSSISNSNAKIEDDSQYTFIDPDLMEIIPEHMIKYFQFGNEIFNAKIYKQFSNISPIIYYKLLNLLTNQRILNFNAQSIYTLDHNGVDFNYITDEKILVMKTDFIKYNMEVSQNNRYPFIIQSTDTQIVLNTPDKNSMIKYFQQKEHDRFIIFPLIYENIINIPGHAAVIAIDSYTLQVYLIEPNYKPNYFNTYTDVSYAVEHIIKNYFEQFGFEYQFIDTWNDEYTLLNIEIIGDEILERGNCVAWSIFLTHYISSDDTQNIPQLCQKFNTLNKKFLLQLIRIYQLNVHKEIQKIDI